MANDVGYVSHAVAERHVSQAMRKLNGFTRTPNPLTKMPPNLPRLYIFNVSNQSYETQMTAMHDGKGSLPNRMVVPACPEGKEVSEPLVIEGMYAHEYLKIDSTEWAIHNGEEIAYEVLQEGPGKNPDYGLKKRGVFISRSNPPLKEEIAEARKRWCGTCDELIAEADTIMAQGQTRGPNGNMISEDHKRAVKYRGQVRTFIQPTQQMKTCPSCGDMVRDGIAIHIACGAILDEAKYQLTHPDYVMQKDRVKSEFRTEDKTRR